MGVTEVIDHAILKDKTLSRDTVKSWLKRDVQGIYILLSEILRSEEVMDAITKVFYSKYEEHHAKQSKEPELPFNQETNE